MKDVLLLHKFFRVTVNESKKALYVWDSGQWKGDCAESIILPKSTALISEREQKRENFYLNSDDLECGKGKSKEN